MTRQLPSARFSLRKLETSRFDAASTGSLFRSLALHAVSDAAGRHSHAFSVTAASVIVR